MRECSLLDIEKQDFEDGIIPDDILVLCPCNVHTICIECIRQIINNYENHPINENNSHFKCPFPFESCVSKAGTPNIFEHSLIEKICRNKQEWDNYTNYAQQYAFPGYSLITCPNLLFFNGEFVPCNSNILVDNKVLVNSVKGDLVIECTQKYDCRYRFCFYCKRSISYYDSSCMDCKLSNECEIPRAFNYFFNKHVCVQLSDLHHEPKYNIISYEESDYLYRNEELTVDIAANQILDTIKDIHSYIICPICKISLYKTEKCNGLSHHGVERCYACGRIGYKIKGLAHHWNAYGQNGCFRFEHEHFVQQYAESFQCSDITCSNHDIGDCTVEEHQAGIAKLSTIRKRAYIFHMFKSLPRKLRNETYDYIYNKCANVPSIMEYIPYKQTFVLSDYDKSRFRDYIEEVTYDNLSLQFPSNIIHLKPEFVDKNFTLPFEEYAKLFTNTTIDHERYRDIPEYYISFNDDEDLLLNENYLADDETSRGPSSSDTEINSIQLESSQSSIDYYPD